MMTSNTINLHNVTQRLTSGLIFNILFNRMLGIYMHSPTFLLVQLPRTFQHILGPFILLLFVVETS